MLSKIEEVLIRDFNACDRCLKRFVKNPDKTYLLKAKENRRRCKLCNGLLSERNLLKAVLNKLRGYSIRTFNVGVRVPQSLQSLENKISLDYGLIDYVPLRKAIKERVAKYVKHKLNLRMQEPADISIILDLSENINSVIVSERKAVYRLNFIKNAGAKVLAAKCDVCGGHGCSVCEWTGKKNDGSFEAYLLYDVPKLLKASKPDIIWPIKDMPELSFSGIGFPVYVIFDTIKERTRAPFLIDFNFDKDIKIVSFYEVKTHLSLNKPFLLSGTVCIEFKEGCDDEKMKTIKHLSKIRLKGKNGIKVWDKSFTVKSISIKGKACCFECKYESGINFYNLFNIRETPKDKEILNKPFKKGEVKSFTLELYNINLPD